MKKQMTRANMDKTDSVTGFASEKSGTMNSTVAFETTGRTCVKAIIQNVPRFNWDKEVAASNIEPLAHYGRGSYYSTGTRDEAGVMPASLTIDVTRFAIMLIEDGEDMKPEESPMFSN
ncbi:unnamed protein product [Rodentolepis nana]|uniref:Ald_Xan_dh_C2 domain-containing protein n=1 Tax=Rodentolepis nana TaxID=102285 RepID=A0A0R3TWC4_RODNA|nr:unnamed protein product [Rodentolepis nana]